MSSIESEPANQPASAAVARRTMLGATLTMSLAAAGTTLLSTTAAATSLPSAPTAQRDAIDVSRPELRTGRNILRLKLDDSPSALTAAVPLTLGSSQEGTTTVTVTSATGRVALGTTATRTSSTTVTTAVTREAASLVWLRPVEAGAPLVAADTLGFSTPEGDFTIEVWIEPSGGRWTPAAANQTELDLGIVAMHAALMRRPGNSDVVMWSMPRLRDAEGMPEPDPLRAGQWRWWKFRLNDVEARVLDVGAGTTYDTPLPKFTDTSSSRPRVDNIFCGGAAHLPNGDLLVVGGHMALTTFLNTPITADNNGIINNAHHIYIYDASARTWRKLDYELNPSRWYPTVTALPDGRMLITSGTPAMLEGNENDDSANGYWASIHNDYLIFDAQDEQVHVFDGPLIDLDAAGVNPVTKKREALATYPSVFVLPKPDASGAVIVVAETNRGWLYDYRPADATQPLRRGSRMYRMNVAGSRSYPTYGAMVLLPITPHQTMMRILAVGGGTDPDHRKLDVDQPSTDVLEIFEVDTAKQVSDGSHRWRYPTTGAKLAESRVLCDTTLLADGTVLISGGSKTGWGDLNRGPVWDAELFDPTTEAIRPAARAGTDRRYHSTALLQLDGTVLKAGSSGGFGNVDDSPQANNAHKTELDTASGKPWMTVHTTAERYWPPYLFAGPRPTIVRVDGGGDGAVLKYDARLVLDAVGDTLDDQVRAALIRLGALTHGNDMDQRYVWLMTMATRAGSGKWLVSAAVPANPAAAPPGDYQLVIVDSHGVPSPGRLVRLVL